MNKKSVSIKWNYMLYTVLLSLTLKSLVFFGNTNISIISDHIGDLALPSYLAGLDWLEIISFTSYYGYGFKWAYTIFFLFSDNPYIIYMAIQFLHIALECFLAAVLYYFSVKYWGVKQDIITAGWIAVVIANAGISMNSEGQVYMAFFVLCLLVAVLVSVEDNKKRGIYSFIISAWACYMLTLHERSLAAIIALFMLIILYRIFDKTWLVDLKFFIPSFIVCYFLQENLTERIIEFFWSVQSTSGTLKNTSVFQDNTLWFLDSFRNILVLIEGIVANLYTLIIKTYGLGALAIVFTFVGVISVFIKKNDQIRKIFNDNKELCMILLLSAFTVFIIIVGVSVRWGRLVAKGSLTGYKGYTYARYYIVFAWPGALAVMLLWRKIKDLDLKYIRQVISGVVLLFTLGFGLYLYPILSEAYSLNNNVHLDRFGYFETVKYMDVVQNVWFSIIIMIIFVLLLLIKNKKTIVIYTLLTLLLVCGVKTKGFNISTPFIECSSFDASYKFVQNIEGSVELGDEVYYYGANPFVCQFMLNRYSVHWNWPLEYLDNAIVFSDKAPELIMAELSTWQNYYYIELDEAEYLYLSGNEYYDAFSQMGYEVSYLETRSE